MLRPSCDLKMLEFWEDRRLIARLVADGRASKISRRKLFKTKDWWYNHVRPCNRSSEVLNMTVDLVATDFATDYDHPRPLRPVARSLYDLTVIQKKIGRNLVAALETRVPGGASNISRSHIHENVMTIDIRPHLIVVQNTTLTPPIRRETRLYKECHTSDQGFQTDEESPKSEPTVQPRT